MVRILRFYFSISNFRKSFHLEPVYDIRWKLFSYVINPLLDFSILKDLDFEDVFMVCMLYIMQHEDDLPILQENEVKAFILMQMKLKTLSYEDIRSYIFGILEKLNLDGELIPKARPVHLGTLYANTLLSLISKIVGEVVPRKYLLVTTNYDGLLFQIIYAKMEADNDIFYDNDDEEDYVEKFYNIVTANGTKVQMVDWF